MHRAGSSLTRAAARIAGVTLGVAGAGLLAFSAAVGFRAARPGRSFGSGEPPAGSFERVRFPSDDGLQLSGWFFPAGGPAITLVLCHGFHTGRRETMPTAQALQGAGFNVLAFDFRAHGESAGRWTSCGLLETRDLRGAVRYALERPETIGSHVGVVGFSMGGAVAIMTAADMPEIGAVVADSCFATLKEVVFGGLKTFWGVPSFPIAPLSLWFAERLVGVCADEARPVARIAAISPRPVLIVHGVEDRLVPVGDAYLLYATAEDPKELWIVPGADHVEARTLDPEGYLERIDAFFRKWLAGPAGRQGLRLPADRRRETTTGGSSRS